MLPKFTDYRADDDSDAVHQRDFPLQNDLSIVVLRHRASLIQRTFLDQQN